MRIFRGAEGAGGKNPSQCPFTAINRKRLGSKPLLRVLPLAALLALLASAPLKALCAEPDTTKKGIPLELLGKGIKIETLARQLQEPQPIDSIASINKFREEIKSIFQTHADLKQDSASALIFSIFSGEQITISPIPDSKKIRLTGVSDDEWSMKEELIQLVA